MDAGLKQGAENNRIRLPVVNPDPKIEGEEITNDVLINTDNFAEWKSVNVTKKRDSNEDLFDVHETKGEIDNAVR